MIIQFFKDPNFFNWVIMILYLASAFRQLADNNLGQFCYWLLAVGGMLVVIFLFK